MAMRARLTNYHRDNEETDVADTTLDVTVFNDVHRRSMHQFNHLRYSGVVVLDCGCEFVHVRACGHWLYRPSDRATCKKHEDLFPEEVQTVFRV